MAMCREFTGFDVVVQNLWERNHLDALKLARMFLESCRHKRSTRARFGSEILAGLRSSNDCALRSFLLKNKFSAI